MDKKRLTLWAAIFFVIGSTSILIGIRYQPAQAMLVYSQNRLSAVLNKIYLPLVVNNYPESGKIVFTSNRANYDVEIYVMNADGSNVTRLTYSNGSDAIPEWSPDGSKIVFESERTGSFEIFVMNADGSNQTRLTYIGGCYYPRWSPDGKHIAFWSAYDGLEGIYTINPDGTGLFRVTDQAVNGSTPAWSPDGSKIGFISAFAPGGGIYQINTDGTDQSLLYAGDYIYYFDWSPNSKLLAISQAVPPAYKWQIILYDLNSHMSNQLTNFAWNNFGIRWSKSGNTLVYFANQQSENNWDIFSMDRYGNSVKNITNNPASDEWPDMK